MTGGRLTVDGNDVRAVNSPGVEAEKLMAMTVDEFATKLPYMM